MNWIEPLMGWYQNNARDLPWRRTQDGYAVWISEIMLQQTRDARCDPYYDVFYASCRISPRCTSGRRPPAQAWEVGQL
jgi:adenine-specific DNA glycosylase